MIFFFLIIRKLLILCTYSFLFSIVEEGRARKSASTSNIVSTDEAQKKFGNAKGISSEQFFGSSRDSEVRKLLFQSKHVKNCHKCNNHMYLYFESYFLVIK